VSGRQSATITFHNPLSHRSFETHLCTLFISQQPGTYVYHCADNACSNLPILCHLHRELPQPVCFLHLFRGGAVANGAHTTHNCQACPQVLVCAYACSCACVTPLLLCLPLMFDAVMRVKRLSLKPAAVQPVPVQFVMNCRLCLLLERGVQFLSPNSLHTPNSLQKLSHSSHITSLPFSYTHISTYTHAHTYTRTRRLDRVTLPAPGVFDDPTSALIMRSSGMAIEMLDKHGRCMHYTSRVRRQRVYIKTGRHVCAYFYAAWQHFNTRSG